MTEERSIISSIYLVSIAFFSRWKSKLKLMKESIFRVKDRNEESIEIATKANLNNSGNWKAESVYLSKYLRRYIEFVDVLNRSHLDIDTWDRRVLILSRHLNKYEYVIKAFYRSILLNPDVWDKPPNAKSLSCIKGFSSGLIYLTTYTISGAASSVVWDNTCKRIQLSPKFQI